MVSIYNTLLDIQLEIKFLDLPRDIPAPAGGRPAPLAVGRATRGRREEGVCIKYALQCQYNRARWVVGASMSQAPNIVSTSFGKMNKW